MNLLAQLLLVTYSDVQVYFNVACPDELMNCYSRFAIAIALCVFMIVHTPTD
jgi:hypothetical protein